MEIEFNLDKDAANVQKHGFSLAEFKRLDFEQALFIKDVRQDYGERRMRVIALLENRLCVAVFTMRAEFFRVISLRKANQRERRHYEDQKS